MGDSRATPEDLFAHDNILVALGVKERNSLDSLREMMGFVVNCAEIDAIHTNTMLVDRIK